MPCEHSSHTEEAFFDPRRAVAQVRPLPFRELQQRILGDLSRHAHLAGLRDFNRTCVEAVVDHLAKAPSETRILDIGASIHGFALEAAVDKGLASYIGIDLAIRQNWQSPFVVVEHNGANSILCQMDAHCLWFEDESFDAVMCLSGFEHYLFPEGVLNEIRRVLRPGGLGLVTYEPIWTCSYGHHLHHFGIDLEIVPPWAHLLHDQQGFRTLLDSRPWPQKCIITRDEAVEWTYTGRDINRRDVRFHANLIEQNGYSEVLWRQRNIDPSPVALAAVADAARRLPFSEEDLLTRGFSLCFRK